MAKKKLLEAKLLMLSAEIEKVKEQDETMKYNAVVSPDALNMDEDRALMSLTKAKSELEQFYRDFSVDGVDSEYITVSVLSASPIPYYSLPPLRRIRQIGLQDTSPDCHSPDVAVPTESHNLPHHQQVHHA